MKNRIVVLMLFVVRLWAVERGEFSGEWCFDKAKSTFGDGGDRFVPIKLNITHDDSHMTIIRTFQRQYKDDFVDTLSFTLDGKVNNSIFLNSQRRIAARWVESGNALSIETHITFDQEWEESQMYLTDLWTLTNSGNEISSEFSVTGQWGELKAIYVFSRTKPLKFLKNAKGGH